MAESEEITTNLLARSDLVTKIFRFSNNSGKGLVRNVKEIDYTLVENLYGFWQNPDSDMSRLPEQAVVLKSRRDFSWPFLRATLG